MDSNHVAAVCKEVWMLVGDVEENIPLQKALPASCVFSKDSETKIFFTKVDFNFLLDGATMLNPLRDGGAADYHNFMEKPRKKF